ncbi:substrate-binding domain-containing protein [Mesorhizobium caraganae]|uniref:substrate-binding domain-containing protein n=1 Tax=Mesorhizobium caraganae TaxID=483206 RepID=UPI00177ADC82|nr:substrate-binding domain-containing protein [Mesorhizobium caraganae]MBM2714416.1 substrate-binding domain-containing protein [Mesorhizobium caraganae]
MNRIGLAGVLSAAVMTLTLAMPGAASAESKFQCKPDETYVMNVMVSAHPYWVPVYQGFKQAAAAMGCKTVFSGTPDYDIAKQIASFEQDLIKKPAGVLLHPMQADPFIEPINRAIENGTTVVTFAADSPKSKRVSYITSDNLAEAKFAAEEIVKQVGDDAEYGVLENPGQSNHDLRVTAFIDYLAKNYPKMKLVGRQASNQDANVANKAVASMLQANPNLKALWIPEAGSAEGAVAAVLEAKAKVLIMHADITPATLEQIKAGNIHMALSPNQGMQGYLGFVATFMAAHPELIDPFNDYKTSGHNPMSIPFADNGFAVITKENADSFDLNKYMQGRDPS